MSEYRCKLYVMLSFKHVSFNWKNNIDQKTINSYDIANHTQLVALNEEGN